MSKALELTQSNFSEHVLEHEGLALVDFWAAWCGPCRAVGPTIDQLAESYGGNVNVGKLNIDDHPTVAEQFDIQSIPAILLFKNGEVVERLVGVQSEQAYRDAIDAVAA